MHRAREEKSGRHVFRHHIGPDGPPHQFSGSLVCWKCTAPFVAVKRHKNKGADVQAQFRLAPKTEHDGDCPLNPTLVTQHIAHGSHGLAHVDEQGILRLNLPENLTDVPIAPPDDEAIGDDVVRHSVTTVRPLLPPAITSAAKIAMLLHLHDFEEKLVDRFKVRPHNGRPIPWSRFCYGPASASYAALYERCRKGEVFTHPIAVVGTVQRVSSDRQGRPYVTLALNVPAATDAFHVVVRSAHASLIDPLTTGTHVLAVGAGWEVFTRGHTPQLRMWAEEHWQLAYWTTSEDGQLTTPHCPPALPSAPPVRVQSPARDRLSAQKPTPPGRPAPPRRTPVLPPQPIPHPAPAAHEHDPDRPEQDLLQEPTTADATGATPPDSVTEGVALAEPGRPDAASPVSDIPPMPLSPPASVGEVSLPPFPPRDPGEGGRRSALRRWLRRARRS